MLIAEVTKGPRGGAQLAVYPSDRFLIVDGKPVRFVAADGTLLGVRRFVWGETRAAMLKMARGR